MQQRECRICHNIYPYNIVHFMKRLPGFKDVCCNCAESIIAEEKTEIAISQPLAKTKYIIKNPKEYMLNLLVKDPEINQTIKEYNKEYQKAKTKVKRKYGEVCITCGSTENIHIHHIVTRRNKGNNSIFNLIPVCKDCHIKLHADDPAKVKFLSRL